MRLPGFTADYGLGCASGEAKLSFGQAATTQSRSGGIVVPASESCSADGSICVVCSFTDTIHCGYHDFRRKISKVLF